MPYDLAAVERGYGEVEVVWEGQPILLRYRADLNTRGLQAMHDAVVGDITLDGVSRFPNVKAILAELIRVLLPSGPDIPEEDRGWDLVNLGIPIPVTFDTLSDLPFGLLTLMITTIFGDISNPNRRKPSRRVSPAGANSAPTVSPTTSVSSSAPSDTASTPTTSPIPIGSTQTPEPSSQPASSNHVAGLAGVSGIGP